MTESSCSTQSQASLFQQRVSSIWKQQGQSELCLISKLVCDPEWLCLSSPSASSFIKQYLFSSWVGWDSFRMLQYANKIFIHAKYYFVYYGSRTAAVSGLSLPSNFQLEWRFPNVRTPCCVITTFLQPSTPTKTEGLFHIHTEAPLYHSGTKRKILSVWNTPNLSGATCSRILVVRQMGHWTFDWFTENLLRRCKNRRFQNWLLPGNWTCSLKPFKATFKYQMICLYLLRSLKTHTKISDKICSCNTII